MKLHCFVAWESGSEVVIEVKSTLVNSRACCYVTDFCIAGNLSVELYPLTASIPPFKNMKIFFKERPKITLRLKFKDTAFGEVKCGRSSIGSMITTTLKAKLLNELSQAMMHPAGMEFSIAD